jgi:pantetheine-phosphate adenylyltransferase
VGVGINPAKASFFTLAERVALVKKVVTSLSNVEVLPFTGLAVGFVREIGAQVMLRGLRTTGDMEYEFSMSLMNLALDPEIETVFVMAKEELSYVSSTLIRQIATMGGNLDKFVPPPIKEALLAKVVSRKDAETGRQGDKETRRQGDRET